MKKNWKKVLSLILALSMVLGMNTTAFAADIAAVDDGIEAVETVPEEAVVPEAEEPAAEAAAPEEAPAAPEEAAPIAEAAAPEAAEPEDAIDAAPEAVALDYTTSSVYEARTLSSNNNALTVTASPNEAGGWKLKITGTAEQFAKNNQVLIQFKNNSVSEGYAKANKIVEISVNTAGEGADIILSGNGACIGKSTETVIHDEKDINLTVYQGANTYRIDEDDNVNFNYTGDKFNFTRNSDTQVYGLSSAGSTSFPAGTFNAEYGYMQTRDTIADDGNLTKTEYSLIAKIYDGISVENGLSIESSGTKKIIADGDSAKMVSVLGSEGAFVLVESTETKKKYDDEDYYRWGYGAVESSSQSFYQVIYIPGLADINNGYDKEKATVDAGGYTEKLYDSNENPYTNRFSYVTLTGLSSDMVYAVTNGDLDKIPDGAWNASGKYKADLGEYNKLGYYKIWRLKKGADGKSTGNYKKIVGSLPVYWKKAPLVAVMDYGWQNEYQKDEGNKNIGMVSGLDHWDTINRLSEGKSISENSSVRVELYEVDDNGDLIGSSKGFFTVSGGSPYFSALSITDGSETVPMGTTRTNYKKGKHTVKIGNPAALAPLVQKTMSYNTLLDKNVYNNNAEHTDEGFDFYLDATSRNAITLSVTQKAAAVPYAAYLNESSFFDVKMTISGGEAFDPRSWDAPYGYQFYYTSEQAIYDGWNAASFNAVPAGMKDSYELKDYNAGTKVYWIFKVTNSAGTELLGSAKGSFDIVKRGLKINITGGSVSSSNVGAAVKSPISVNLTTNPDALTEIVEWDYENNYNGSLTPGADRVLDTASACEITTDGIVDKDKPGEYTVPLSKYTLKADLQKNYTIAESTAIYEVIPHYYAKFYAEYGGQLHQLGDGAYEIIQGTLKIDAPAGTKLSASYNVAGQTMVANKWKLVKGDGTVVVATENALNAADIVFPTTGTNYTVYAIFELTEGYTTVSTDQYIKVKNILPVTYDGRAHKAVQEEWNGPLNNTYKSTTYDLDFELRDENRGRTLRPGVDFTITYRNNVNASVYYDEKGNAIPFDEIQKDPKKGPYVIIKGKGKTYGKGGSASDKGLYIELYYSILPAPLEYSPAPMYGNDQYIEGDEGDPKYKWGYIYDTGAVYKQKNTEAVKYKYTVKQQFTYAGAKYYKYTKDIWGAAHSNWWADVYKVLTLKKGNAEKDLKKSGDVITKRPTNDYLEQLYYLETSNGRTFWKKVDAANKKGTYLVEIQGIGNYCGALHSPDNTAVVLDPGEDYSAPYEFEVVSKDDLLMSELDIKPTYPAKKKSFEMTTEGLKYKALGVTVTYKKNNAVYGFQKGKDVPKEAYLYYSNWDWVWHASDTDCVVFNGIGKQNLYCKVPNYTKAQGDKYHIWYSGSGAVNITGQKLNKDDFYLEYSDDGGKTWPEGNKYTKSSKPLPYTSRGNLFRVANSKGLKENTDYRVVWQNLDTKGNNVGDVSYSANNRYGGNTYQVVIQGMGMYEGAETKSTYSFIDPATRKHAGDIVLSFKRGTMKLADAVKDGYVEFSAKDTPININGTFPVVRISENELDKDKKKTGNFIGLTYEDLWDQGETPVIDEFAPGARFTTNCTSNTKLSTKGKTAFVTFKPYTKNTSPADGGDTAGWYNSYTGSYKIPFNVIPREVTVVNERSLYKSDNRNINRYVDGEIFVQYLSDLQYKADNSYKPVVKIYQAAENANVWNGKKMTYYYKELKSGKDYEPLYTKLSANNILSANTVPVSKNGTGQFAFVTKNGENKIVDTKVTVTDFVTRRATWGTYRQAVKKAEITLSFNGWEKNVWTTPLKGAKFDEKGILNLTYTGKGLYPATSKVVVTGKGDGAEKTFNLFETGVYNQVFGTQTLSPGNSNNVEVGNATRTVTFTHTTRGDAYEYNGSGKVIFKIMPFDKQSVILSH